LISNELSESQPIARETLSYNPSGTIAQIQSVFAKDRRGTLDQEVLSYTYDQIDRLISASNEGAFSYDLMGNFLQRAGSFNELNQLMEDSEFSYTYTTNGELSRKVSKISGESVDYAWSVDGLLKSALVKTSTAETRYLVEFKYDGLGRRVQKSVNGVITRFFYDGEDIIAELDSEGNIEAMYLHGPGIDEPLAMARDINHNGEFEDSELFIFARNHLGSVMALVDSTGKIAQRYVYSAYGKTKVLKTHEGAAFIKNPYAYTSRELDEETGDYFYRARYYNPNTGRFLSEDPIGFRGGDTNLYRYVSNKPVTLTDPMGLAPFPFDEGASTPEDRCLTNVATFASTNCATEIANASSAAQCATGFCAASLLIPGAGLGGFALCAQVGGVVVGSTYGVEAYQCIVDQADKANNTQSCKDAN